MKVKRFLSLMIAVVFVTALCVPVCATETRASDQIAAYKMKVTPLSGAFSVFSSVTGTGNVDKLGCESILVYKMVDMEWVLVEIKLEDYPGMSSKDTFHHANSVQCSSERGEAYKIVVTIFAENSKGFSCSVYHTTRSTNQKSCQSPDDCLCL